VSRSRIFRGSVVHARERPRRHRLRYRIFQILLNLDEVEALGARLKLFSVGRANLTSFHPRDHLEGGTAPLRTQVVRLLARAGVDIGDGAVRVLCMPRVLGHAFNPISVYFCHRPDGELAAILYEVNNTFGERHVYVAPVAGEEARARWIEQGCDKAFFVSPFMPMELAYRFRVRVPDERASVQIQVSDAEGRLLFAGFEAAGEEISDGALLRAWAGAPLLSLKVLAGIHWEALWIWLKGVPLQARSPARAMGVTIVPLAAERSAAA
jgi:uncharacterized protein